jgi:hypothetical protein
MQDYAEQAREEVMLRANECLETITTIEDKIRNARALYREYGEALKNDPKIATMLQQLDDHVKKTWRLMDEIDVVESCKNCDEQEGGSCCGRGIDDKYNALLLLMNLLLGVELPDERLRGDSCYFLTYTGCSLKARLVLCVDYLCPKIKKRLTHDQLVRLQVESGDELLTGFMLHDAIHNFIRQR